ncbi:hypothetical protein CCR75_006146 [Bremia lactucae]|uniref:Uncharacterized protein n=1 Tax=Bremia lactucae TaxID=4779 RepID=A0A976IHA5_BRELC|nr:hypothetical protein CCR75_006366 [Bremia lactucae]TDH71790.1 hypothetical protein CCR75_006146 [Bremia lactucae]
MSSSATPLSRQEQLSLTFNVQDATSDKAKRLSMQKHQILKPALPLWKTQLRPEDIGGLSRDRLSGLETQASQGSEQEEY